MNFVNVIEKTSEKTELFFFLTRTLQITIDYESIKNPKYTDSKDRYKLKLRLNDITKNNRYVVLLLV